MHVDQLDFGGDLCTECGGTGEIPVRKGREGAYRKCPRCRGDHHDRDATTFPIVVRLSTAELAACVEIGKRRQAITSARFRDSYGLDRRGRDPTETHIQGVRCERAVATITGHPWVQVAEDHNSVGGYDVGPFGVRGTYHQRGGLILHERDRDEQVFILVTEKPPEFTLRGWMLGRDGKHPRYWNTTSLPDPAFLVSQHFLTTTLPEGFYR